jgi:hypothetical protein
MKARGKKGRYSTMEWLLGYALEPNPRRRRYTSIFRRWLSLRRRLEGKIMALGSHKFPWVS